MSEQKDSTSSGSVDSVNVKVPPFWPDDPELWFAQLEGQFALANVTVDSTKYNYVIANLDCRYITEIKDIVKNPPAAGKYIKVKEELIARLSSSSEQRIRQLINNEEIGDRKPSHFLRHLQSLAGPHVPDDFMKSLWSNRLPPHVQLILTSQPKSSLDDLAKLADAVMDIVQPQVQQVSAPSTSSEIVELRRCVEDLRHEVAGLRTSARPRTPRRGRYPRWQSRTRSSSRSNDADKGHCWYHRKFQQRATKCRSPCTFAGNATDSR